MPIDPTDEYRKLKRDNDKAKRETARHRELLVAKHYLTLNPNYRIVAAGDEEVRKRFGIKKGPAADIVIETGPTSCLLIEAKGTDVLYALDQLWHTETFIRGTYPIIDPRIHCPPEHRSRPPVNSYSTVNQGNGRLQVLNGAGQPFTLKSGREAIAVYYAP